jgi:zinc protease
MSKDEIERRTVNGIPVLIAEAEPPLLVSLHFRVGRADETAPTAGITHLAEHLLLPASTSLPVDFNGSVDNLTTSLYASGDPHDVQVFLSDVISRIQQPPLERLDVERRVLIAEQASRGAAVGAFVLGLRYGARTHGLVGYDEFGLPQLTGAEVVEWISERFTAGNVVVSASGPVDQLELDLPLSTGERRPAPRVHPIPEVSFPCLYAGGPPGGIYVSAMASRSTATSLAAELFERRLEQQLRHELGITYDVDWTLMPLGVETGHHGFGVDVRAEREREAVEGALAVLRSIADGAIDEADLDTLRGARRRWRDDRSQIHGHLWWSAHQLLLGLEPESRAQLQTEAEEATAGAVAGSARELLESVLVAAPQEAEGVVDLKPYPMTSSRTLEGKRHRAASVFAKRTPALVVGDSGMMLDHEWGAVTAPYADVAVAVRQPDNRRMLLTNDGFFIHVDPAEWRSGKEIVRAIDEHLADRLVDAEPGMTSLDNQLEELAVPLGRTGLVSEELKMLPRVLQEGEDPVRLAKASRGMRLGLLVVTSRRILFLYGDGSKHSLDIPLGNVWSAEADRDSLTIQSPTNETRFTDVSPRGSAEALAADITSRRTRSAPS